MNTNQEKTTDVIEPGEFFYTDDDNTYNSYDDVFDDVFLDDNDNLETVTLYSSDDNLTNNFSLNSASLNGIMAVFGAFIGIAVAACSVIGIISLIANWKIFTKAGEKGWKTLIPIYNFWTFFKIAGLSPALSLLLFIPLINFVILIIFYVNLSKAFGKSGGFAVGLLFLNLIFVLILAFGKSTYVGSSVSAAPAAPATPPSNPFVETPKNPSTEVPATPVVAEPAPTSEVPAEPPVEKAPAPAEEPASPTPEPTQIPVFTSEESDPEAVAPETPETLEKPSEPAPENPSLNIPVVDGTKPEESKVEEPAPAPEVSETPAELTQTAASDPNESVPEEYITPEN